MLKLVIEDGILEITGTSEDLEKFSQNLYIRSINIIQPLEVVFPNELPDTVFTVDNIQIFEK